MISADKEKTGAPLLRLHRVSKAYPGVQALDDVDFDLRAGETHVLFGENGAGKSTLISVVAGAIKPTNGTLHFKGEVVEFESVHDAHRCGITTVFQEFALVPTLSIEDNICLGAEPTQSGLLNKRAIRRKAREILDRLGFEIPPGAIVAGLTRAEQQMVEIARAFHAGISVLILDEPTASLTDREADQLFELIAQLKADGVGIIYITHRIREILRIADRVTVLRDGKKITTFDAPFGEDELVKSMVGREITQLFPTVSAIPGRILLDLRDVSSKADRLRNVSLSVHSGEIVGMAGLIGSGKSEVVRAAFGLGKVDHGQVHLDGADVTGYSTAQMLRSGFMYLPPDRREEGLVMMRSCRENMTLSALDEPMVSKRGWLRLRRERKYTDELAGRVELHPMTPDSPVQNFSGGNQQKVMLARSLTRPAKVYAFDEPTVGVDVGTRAAIYRFIASLCEQGAGIILVSSDLHEILNLSHRVYVFYGGEIKAELAGDGLTEENILPHFFERTSA